MKDQDIKNLLSGAAKKKRKKRKKTIKVTAPKIEETPKPRKDFKEKIDWDKPYETISSLEPTDRVFHQFGIYFNGEGVEVDRVDNYDPVRHGEKILLESPLVEERTRKSDGSITIGFVADKTKSVESENAKALAAESQP